MNTSLQAFISYLLCWYFTFILYIDRSKKVFCSAIFNGTTLQIFCDGRVSCSCRDTAGIFNLGNVFKRSVFDIWQGQGYTGLREKFLHNKIPHRICASCPQMKIVPKAQAIFEIAEFPAAIFFENTAACNLNCFSCRRDNVEETRKIFIMPKDLAERILSEVCSHQELKCIVILGQGEPFLDKNLCAYIKMLKQINPQIRIYTSTNGLLFDRSSFIEEVISSGLDYLTFSIDGATEQSYLKYQIGGNFQKVYENIKQFMEIKKRLHASSPEVTWQYILFRWNDSLREIRLAKSLAKDAGVDKLDFQTTFAPILGISLRSLSFLLRHLPAYLRKKEHLSFVCKYEP